MLPLGVNRFLPRWIVVDLMTELLDFVGEMLILNLARLLDLPELVYGALADHGLLECFKKIQQKLADDSDITVIAKFQFARLVHTRFCLVKFKLLVEIPDSVFSDESRVVDLEECQQHRVCFILIGLYQRFQSLKGALDYQWSVALAEVLYDRIYLNLVYDKFGQGGIPTFLWFLFFFGGIRTLVQGKNKSAFFKV